MIDKYGKQEKGISPSLVLEARLESPGVQACNIVVVCSVFSLCSNTSCLKV